MFPSPPPHHSKAFIPFVSFHWTDSWKEVQTAHLCDFTKWFTQRTLKHQSTETRWYLTNANPSLSLSLSFDSLLKWWMGLLSNASPASTSFIIRTVRRYVPGHTTWNNSLAKFAEKVDSEVQGRQKAHHFEVCFIFRLGWRRGNPSRGSSLAWTNWIFHFSEKNESFSAVAWFSASLFYSFFPPHFLPRLV